MIKVQTSAQDFTALDDMQNEWVYNALDCSVTQEVWEEILKTPHEVAKGSYAFVQGMQAPALHMSLRGIRIDQKKRHLLIQDMSQRINTLQNNLDEMARAFWGAGLNPNSNQQLKAFFYDEMRLPVQYKYDRVRKQRVPSCDRNSLEKLKDYFHARPIVQTILRMRDYGKKVSTLKSGIDADGRMRTSYNVAGTETGRWSSNENAFGTGTNLQNWTNELREIFIPDEGYKMAYIDLEQAESRVVAYLSGDEKYIEACEGGDLHTFVATLVWPEKAWSKDPLENKVIASEKFYSIFSYRDLSKRGGHATNYDGQAPTVAKHLHVDTKLIEDFQARYFMAFPGIKKWQQWVGEQIQLHGSLTTPLGRTRYFLGRRWDDSTRKEAIAFLPQSTIGEILNEGMYRCWKKLDLNGTDAYHFNLLAQVHDATLIQYPDRGYEYEKKLLNDLKSMMQVPIPIGKRTLIIPAKVEGTGWNWRKREVDKKTKEVINDQGIKDWTGNETRVRTATDTNLLTHFVL